MPKPQCSGENITLSGETKLLAMSEYTDKGFVVMAGDVSSPGTNGSSIKVTLGKQGSGAQVTGVGAVLSSNFYIKPPVQIDAQLQMAPGTGLITSMITMSDDHDEIDVELLGKATKEMQSNYYWQGVLDYTHGKTFNSPADLSTSLRNYSMVWLNDSITWYLDGVMVRTLYANQTTNATTKAN